MNKWPHDLSEVQRDELLLDYLESRLEPAIASRLEQHLAICDECSSLLEDNRDFLTVHGHLHARSQSAVPTAEFANRLQQQLKNETAQLVKPTRSALTTWLLAFPRYSRLATAAILLILIGSGSLLTYRLLPQNQSISNAPAENASILSAGLMSAEAALPGSGSANPADLAESTAANQQALMDAGAGEYSKNPLQETRLMAKATPALNIQDALAENLTLPLKKKTDPAQPVLTQDLFDGAKAVVMIEPDLLFVAYPETKITGQLERLTTLKTDFDPGYHIESMDEGTLQTFLNDRLGSPDATRILDLLIQKDCGYLILTIGGN